MPELLLHKSGNFFLEAIGKMLLALFFHVGLDAASCADVK
jgi:hypothetical protein